MRARLHHPAFHRGQDELREPRRIKIGRQTRARFFQQAFDRARPRREIRRQQFAHDRIGFVQLKRQRPDRAAIGAIAFDNRGPIMVHQRENLLDRIVNARPGRL